MTSRRQRTRGFALAVLFVAAGGCGRVRHPAPEPWVAEVAAVNRRADRLLDADDAASARALLRTLVDSRRSGAPLDDDRRFALEDCYFRLARLALAARDPAEALADAQSGLAYQTGPSLFVANLLVARGAAQEALSHPRAAAEDYHRALIMNEALLQQVVGRP